MSYILRLRKGYIPGTIGYVIYSPGTAPEATCGGGLFLFRFSIAMQKNSFQLVRTAFPSFFFFSSLVSQLQRTRRTQLYGLQSSLELLKNISADGMLRARSPLLHGQYVFIIALADK